ncbi:MAG TPA: nucleotidyl transferase AbiEii/AbiGii toxin family protein [Longimicrobium sp.]|nr:nucleotidyl transferase AbiEii/AbiGii toxin family protein [Longimicrobium sp.]
MQIVARADAAYGAPNLRLDGGTALAAYYLHHRESEDLDFFSDPGLNAPIFGDAVREMAAAEGVLLEPFGGRSLGMVTYTAHADSAPEQGVKLQFAVQSPFRLERLEDTAEGIRVSSFRDICAGKLHAVCDRLAHRDFYDLYVIVTEGRPVAALEESAVRIRFRSLLADVMEIDPGLTPFSVGQAIARGLDRPIISAIELKLLIPVQEHEIQTLLRHCIAECAAQAAGTAPPGGG